MSEHSFRPRKKRVGVYFNDGHTIHSVQADSDAKRSDDDKLVIAIRAAIDAFWKVMEPKP